MAAPLAFGCLAFESSCAESEPDELDIPDEESSLSSSSLSLYCTFFTFCSSLEEASLASGLGGMSIIAFSACSLFCSLLDYLSYSVCKFCATWYNLAC